MMNGWLDKTCVHSKKRKEISDISYFWLWAKRRDKKILSRWLWLKWFTARSRARPVNCPKSITSFQSRCGVPKRLRQVIMQDFFQFLTRNSNKNLQLSQLLLSSDVTTKKMMMIINFCQICSQASELLKPLKSESNLAWVNCFIELHWKQVS